MRAWLFALALVACSPALTPRDQARGDLELVATAVKVADQTCASYARQKRDGVVARRCADDYVHARDALLAAQSAIDAWQDGASGTVSCSVNDAAAALEDMVAAADSQMPLVVQDAITAGRRLSQGCSNGPH